MLHWLLFGTPLIQRRDRPRKAGPALMVPKQTSTRFPQEDDDCLIIIMPTCYLPDFSSSYLCIFEGFIHKDCDPAMISVNLSVDSRVFVVSV